MTILIREETAADYTAIEALTIAAFANAPHSQQTEHHIIRALRSEGLLSLSLVAEENNEVTGHIAATPVILGNGTTHWFGIGPLAVSPEHQNKGVGSQLIRAALSTLEQRGAAGAVLVGEPGYYNRFGFQASTRLTLQGIPPEYFLIHPLHSETPETSVEYPSAFYIEN